MHADRRTPAVLLAVLYAVSGGLCLLGALWPIQPDSPVGLLGGLAVAGLSGGGAIWLLRDRLQWWTVHVAVALVSVLIGLLAWRSATAVGIVGLGPCLIALGLFAAHFFSLREARLHTAALAAVASAGALGARPSGFTVPWLVLMVSLSALTEAQGRLARGLRTAAGTDPLTGVANRRAWEAEAVRHLARSARTGEALSVAILDLDNFKEVNDREGHVAGDLLLRDLTACWSRRLRRGDLLGRYGGDEFVLCLPATDETGTWEFLAQLSATHRYPWTAGVATVRDGDTLATVLARADAHLYVQKRSGRTT